MKLYKRTSHRWQEWLELFDLVEDWCSKPLEQVDLPNCSVCAHAQRSRVMQRNGLQYRCMFQENGRWIQCSTMTVVDWLQRVFGIPVEGMSP